MIIWGSRVRKTKGEGGTFFCPSCRDDRAYGTIKWRKYFTLYFIPLFPTELLASYVEYSGCKGEFDTAILGRSRDEILAALAPWNCTPCGNVNSAGNGECVSCGSARQAVEALPA